MAGVKGRSGRKANERPVRAVLSALLDDIDPATDRKNLWAICEKLVDAAKEGDLGAMREVFDRVEGRAAQEVRGAGDDGEHELVIRWKS